MVDFSVYPSTAVAPSTTGVELADVVRRFGDEYTAQYGATMMPSHQRALQDIESCCTRKRGGRRYHCDDCDQSFWKYHCCRNRACPKCHGTQTKEWLEKRQLELLPCSYFHAVTTVPAQLRGVFRRQQKFMYDLLMRVSVQAVLQLCAEKRHLGAMPGILALLHTWTGKLEYHPHVHLLITGGGASDDGQIWRPARGRFLIPVKRISKRIAKLFRDALKKEQPELFATIAQHVWQRQWVSFCKHYGDGNDAVLNYLSRYVFRTAITNARILEMDETHVTFRYKDRHSDSWQTSRLAGVEFLRRFLQHVLPRGFHRVRYYGLWHHSKRDVASRIWWLLQLERPAELGGLSSIRQLLEASDAPGDNQTDRWTGDVDAGDDSAPPCHCPHCGSTRTRFISESPPMPDP